MLCDQVTEFQVLECPEISLDKKYLMQTKLKKGKGQSCTIFCLQKEKKWLYESSFHFYILNIIFTNMSMIFAVWYSN